MSIRVRSCSAAVVLLSVCGTVFGSVSFRPIALSGTDGALGPGLGAGATFGDISGAVASINNSGRAVFRGDSGGSAGVWFYNGASNATLAFAGQPMPGGGTYPNTGFNAPTINHAGKAAWRQGTNSLFSDSTGAPGVVARTTEVAPGTGGATLSSMLI